MVYGAYNYISTVAYKPTNITFGGPTLYNSPALETNKHLTSTGTHVSVLTKRFEFPERPGHPRGKPWNQGPTAFGS